MIHEITRFQVVCDICGAPSPFLAQTELTAKLRAFEAGWVLTNGEDTGGWICLNCPECIQKHQGATNAV